jgi:hypothetical protein
MFFGRSSDLLSCIYLPDLIQWLNKIQVCYELTAAGTVSDLHRIPF